MAASLLCKGGHSSMRIGIITILKVNNYGAELQAYATQAALKKLGYDAEIIDYLFYKNKGHRKCRKSRPIFKLGVKKWLAETLYPIFVRLKEKQSAVSELRRHRFDDFHLRNTSMSHTFCNIKDLYAECPDYDVYVVGSDQVWNPGIYSSILPYFLDFAPKGRRRVAYASSFGVEKLPADVVPVYKRLLSTFDAIGVREKNGVDIVRGLGMKAVNVLDPTLLLDDLAWKQVAADYPDMPEHYVLVYELTPSQYLNDVAQMVSQRTGLPVVRICKVAGADDSRFINVLDAGPAEFLGLISNAAFVVTNSFHGTAFAVNFNRPFLTVTPARKNNNSRQKSLLGLLGLSDRLLNEGDPVPDDISLDFSDAITRLSAERKKSVEFLTKAINGSET